MAQHPRWQHEQCAQEGEQGFEGDADETEWQRDQPDERPEQEGEQGEWPAENEQNEPEQEFEHCVSSMAVATVRKQPCCMIGLCFASPASAHGEDWAWSTFYGRFRFTALASRTLRRVRGSCLAHSNQPLSPPAWWSQRGCRDRDCRRSRRHRHSRPWSWRGQPARGCSCWQ